MIVFQTTVVDKAKGAPIRKALVAASGQGSGKIYRRETDDSGYADVACFELHDGENVTLSVNVDGYHQYTGYNVADFNGVDVGRPLRIELEPSVVPFDVAESGFVRASGAGFVREDGTPWHLAGLLLHTGICNVAKGEDLSWLFAYMDDVGANTGVVIGCHLSDWKWAYGYGYDPRRSDHLGILGSLFNQFADAHKRVLFQVLADAQGLTLAEKQSIYNAARLAASGRWNCLLGKGNESAVNGWHPSDLPNYVAADLGGVPTSQGSSGATPLAPHLDFAQWETRRQPGTPTWKVADDAGAGILEMHGGYSGFAPYPGPIVMVETDIFNDTNPDEYGDFRITDPAWAGLLGANGGPNSAGSCFGTSNSLVVKPNGPVADACTREYFRRFWRAAS